MGVLPPVHFSDVEVVGDSETALLFMIGERQVWVPVLAALERAHPRRQPTHARRR